MTDDEMMEAVEDGDIARVRSGLEAGFAANAEVETLFGVVRLLHVAVQHAVDDEERVEIAGLLVEHGADPHAKLPARVMDDEGETRFSKGETAVARVLDRLDYEKRKGDAKAIEACTRLLQVLRVPVPS